MRPALFSPRFAVIGVAAIAAVLAGSCSDSTGPGDGAVLQILAADTLVRIGGTRELGVEITSREGEPLVATAAWSSLDTSVARVDVAGIVTGRRAGSARIEARYGTGRDTVRLRVVSDRDALRRALDSLYVGGLLDLRAHFTAGAAPLFGEGTEWASSDEVTGTVTPDGIVEALRSGAFTVTAAKGELLGVFDVRALAPVASVELPVNLTMRLGESTTLDPVLRDAAGLRLGGRWIVWSVIDPQGGIVVAQPGGEVHAAGVGEARVVAAAEGVADTVTVHVEPQPVSRLDVIAPRSWITAGDSAVLVVAVRDSAGGAGVGAPIEWASRDESVATVAAHGVATGIAPGESWIVARSGAGLDSVQLTVERGVSSVAIVPDSLLTSLGTGGARIQAAVRDSAGRDLRAPAITWTVLDPGIAQIQTDGGVTPLGEGRARVVAAAGGAADTAFVVVSATRGDWMWVSWNYNLNPTVGESRFVHLHMRDAASMPISGRGVRIRSSDTTVVVATPDSGETAGGELTIVLSARGRGRAVVSATSGAMATALVVETSDAPVTKVVIEGAPPATLAVGDSVSLSALTYIADHMIAPRPVEWRSTAPAVVTVGDSGRVVAVGGGEAVVIATSEHRADSVSFLVSTPASPVIAAISPWEMRAGAEAVITGENFAASIAGNEVHVGGIPVEVTAASATELTIRLPDAAALGCRESRNVPVRVATGSELVTTTPHPLGVLTVEAPAKGGMVGRSGASAPCVEISHEGAEYLLVVANGATEGARATRVQAAQGVNPPALMAAATLADERPAQVLARGAGPAGLRLPSRDSLHRAALRHRALLERSRELTRRRGTPAGAAREVRVTGRQPTAPRTVIPNALGERTLVRVPSIDAPNFCANYRSVQGRVVYSGAEVVLLEDVTAPLAGRMDDYYAALGAEVEATMLPIIRGSFGEPLAMDGMLGGDGRIAMLFTEAVNELGPAGFVVSCDFYPQAFVPSSNEMPILYAIVPTASGTGYDSFTRNAWRRSIRGIVMHELKHVASFAERFARDAVTLEESWLEEATAMHAVELWSRTINPVAWKGRADYRSTIYCDVRPDWPECEGRPWTMFDHFAFLHDYYAGAPQRTPFGSADPADASFYGSGWALVRWAADHHATSEEAFFRALTQETVHSGAANLEARTGRSMAEMVQDWTLASTLATHHLDVRTVRPGLTMPSWDLRSIFLGMAGDFPQYFGSLPLVAVQTHCGTTTQEAAVRGGAAMVYWMHSCPNGRTYLELQGANGGSLDDAVRLGIVRLR